MKRLHVALIGTRGYPSYYGGFETLVRRLAPHLADNGWDVTVYSREGQTIPSERDPRVESRFTPGLDTTALSTLSFGATATLDAALRRPDVALIMNVANGYFLPALKARGVPTALNVDGLEWERDKWSTQAKRVFRGGAHASARFADTLISDSVHIQAHWQKHFARDSVFIPYGGERRYAAAADDLRIPALAPGNYVLVVARFVPENTIAPFVEAARQLPSDVPVVIVGSAPEDDPLWLSVKQLERERPNTHALGHLSDDTYLEALWSNAGAYFHGHTVGGTNPALVHAMACGAPVVARDTVFNREVLAGGAVFTPADPAAIARALESVVRKPERRAQLSEASVSRAAQAYNWESVLGAYEETLRSLVERKSARP